MTVSVFTLFLYLPFPDAEEISPTRKLNLDAWHQESRAGYD